MTARDDLRRYLDLLVASLDEPTTSASLARQAHLSRFHFDHVLRAAAGEPPAALRRRLLLERAAHALASTGRPVTEVAAEAGYAVPGSFTRAFARAYGRPPAAFRRDRQAGWRLPSPNGIHHHPPAGIYLPGTTGGAPHMDLVDRLIEHDAWLTGTMLDSAAGLAAESLDAPLDPGAANMREVTAPTLRRLLRRLVFTKEMWTAAITGEPFTEDPGDAIPDLRRRWDAIVPRFAGLVRDIRAGGRWDDAFVDATCDPPERFTFGGAIAHVLTFTAYRRTVAVEAMRRLGVQGLGYGDPMSWEPH